jgi:CRISPR-associated endonuclease/helicase Cas3
MNGFPRGFWGKLAIADGVVSSWHPLVDHCADVAAVTEALLRQSLLGRRLARLVGHEQLSEVESCRLAALAAFHDVGKFNLGFQNKANPTARQKAGHVKEVLALFQDGIWQLAPLMRSLPIAEIETWVDGDNGLPMLVASISHHGRPIRVASALDDRLWRADGARDPFAGMAELTACVRRWYPAAFTRQAAGFPDVPQLQHAVAGLVMLADWIGSDTDIFPYANEGDPDRIDFARSRARLALERLHLDAAAARAALGAEAPGFAAISPYQPRAIQRAAAALEIPAGASLTLIEAETGSGKTEAALMRFARLFHAGAVDGMYFALPTRTAATQIHRRVNEAVARMFGGHPRARPPVILAVPGYLAVDDRTGTRLPNFTVLWNDDERERFRFRGWAAEHPKRYMAGPIIVGTIDQVLLSTLEVSHSHMRASALLRHLLVVDEVHASDAYMNVLLRAVLENHLAAGGHALLMSATLGASARARLFSVFARDSTAPALEAASHLPYPLLTVAERGERARALTLDADLPARNLTRELVAEADDFTALAARAIDAARDGAHVIVIRNTVGDCVRTLQAVEALGHSVLALRCNGVPAPHHARYARPDRESLDAALESQLSTERALTGVIAVTTQTVQQSLDLDADFMISDLCPMDVLLQRAGRLHRHPGKRRPLPFRQARIAVLVPAERDLGKLLGANGQARGPHGIGSIYEDLRIIEATWRALEQHATLRIPEMNRLLVEAATHPDALDSIVAELGEAWKSHANSRTGADFARKGIAQLHLVKRELPFGEYEFASTTDQRIATRLGEGDRIADFAQPFDGPFGNQVGRLTIPAYLAIGAGPDAGPEDIEHADGIVRFTFGSRRFIYDRLGLRVDEANHQAPIEEDLADA